MKQLTMDTLHEFMNQFSMKGDGNVILLEHKMVESTAKLIIEYDVTALDSNCIVVLNLVMIFEEVVEFACRQNNYSNTCVVDCLAVTEFDSIIYTNYSLPYYSDGNNIIPELSLQEIRKSDGYIGARRVFWEMQTNFIVPG